MDYKYFLAVVDSGSLAAASERLHIAPSAISRQIALLEEGIGVLLFERRPRGMVLTAAGEALATHALRVRLEEEAIVNSLRTASYTKAHVVQIASTEGLSRYFLPQVMAEFEVTNPAVQFVLSVSTPFDCVKMVRAGETDIGVVFSTAPVTDVRVDYACRSPLCAIMRPDHPLATFGGLSLAALQPYPIAMTRPGTTQRQLFDHVCQMEKLNFTEVLTCNYSGALHEFVRRTTAVALGSLISHESDRDYGLIAVPLIDSRLNRDIQILSMAKRALPPTVSLFRDSLIRRLEEVNVPEAMH